MKKLSLNVGLTASLFFGLLLSASSVHAEVSTETIINIFQRLETLEKTNRELNGKNEELQHQIQLLKKQQKDGFLNIDERLDNLSSLKKPQELPADTNKPRVKIVDKKPQNSAPAPIEPTIKKPEVKNNADDKTSTPITSSQPPKMTENTPKTSRAASQYEKETYQAAFDLMKKSSTAATKAFREYIILQPDSPLAANAQYWIGEIMYSHNNYKGAVDEFIKVLQNYKYSSKAPDAAIKLGYSFYALKNWGYARRTFEDILKYFSDNQNAVNLATKRLAMMKAAGN